MNYYKNFIVFIPAKNTGYKFHDFMFQNSLIEYIDPEEQNTSLIAMTPKAINEEKKFHYK